MQICVIGSGYVGLVAATCLAELNHDVTCVDSDAEKIALLAAGGIPIHEDYLPELLDRHRNRKLRFTTSVEQAIRNSAVIFIAVNTPCSSDGSADLSYVESVVKTIARSASGYKIIVEKSTVPVYTSEWIRRIMLLDARNCREFDVVSNPEFLREGSAVTDFLYPDRVVVGSRSGRAADIMRGLYAPLLDGSYSRQPSAVPRPERNQAIPLYLETSPQSAELIKHASNAFLAMKVSFINAVANICDTAGADIEEVRRGMGSDRRIGCDFLRPGIGYGGSCFPKDVAAFQSVGRELGYDFALLDEVARVNLQQRTRFVKMVRRALWTLKGKRLGVLGLAFKGGTDDIRESPAVAVVRELLEEECRIVAFDPAAMERAAAVLPDSVTYAPDPYAAAQGADALLILTDWKEFGCLNLERLRSLLAYPVILDGRNMYSPHEMETAGLNYYSVGRPAVECLPANACSTDRTF
ncbi:MAG: UDP-glucose dehydrogenase family protein [Actinomycetota bacterium]